MNRPPARTTTLRAPLTALALAWALAPAGCSRSANGKAAAASATVALINIRKAHCS